ncbi:MAG: helix-turn-helix domain-containing protein, partial [Halomonas sp.]
MSLSKTQSSFYRRLYVAHLVAGSTASVPAITAAT